jgi:hypothetical protein
MEEQLKNELLNLIVEGKIGITEGFSFIKEKAPQLVDEIIKFNLFSNVYILFSYLIFIYVLIFCFKKIKNIGKLIDKIEYSCLLFLLSIFIGLFFIIFSISALYSVFNIIKIIFSPNVFVIEYIVKILN